MKTANQRRFIRLFLQFPSWGPRECSQDEEDMELLHESIVNGDVRSGKSGALTVPNCNRKETLGIFQISSEKAAGKETRAPERQDKEGSNCHHQCRGGH